MSEPTKSKEAEKNQISSAHFYSLFHPLRPRVLVRTFSHLSVQAFGDNFQIQIIWMQWKLISFDKMFILTARELEPPPTANATGLRFAWRIDFYSFSFFQTEIAKNSENKKRKIRYVAFLHSRKKLRAHAPSERSRVARRIITV